MKIYATEYQYQDGTDTTAHVSRDAAMRRGCQVILGWNEEISDEELRSDILHLVLNGEFESAVRKWGKWQCDNGMREAITIMELEVTDEPDAQELCAKAHDILFS